MLKAWSSTWWWNLQEMGFSRSFYIIGICPMRDLWDASLSFSLPPFLAIMRLAALLYHSLSSMIFCFTTGPISAGTTNHGLKLLKVWIRINLSSF
jgi:hypothetical protein